MIEKWDDELQPKTQGFCPHCGAPRTAGHAFCPSCGKPFDAPTAQPVAPTPQATAPTPPAPAPAETAEPKKGAFGGHGNLISALAIFVGIPLIGLLFLAGTGKLGSGGTGGGTTTNENPNVPPAGVIWFGSSFDSSTLEMHGRSSTFTTGSTVAMVMHLTQSISNGQADFRVNLGGQTIANSAMNNLSGTSDVWGLTYPLPVPGTYTFTITDLGGNALATGTITAQ